MDLGKINFPMKMDLRTKCHLKVLAANLALPTPDAKVISTQAPFIQYEQFLLDKNFRQYLGTIMVSQKNLRMGAQKTIKKTI